METHNMIFVFGSNLSGVHGAGAARYAWKYRGAQFGVASGLTGGAYAIPTKDTSVQKTLPLEIIQEHVDRFIDYAKQHSKITFQVTRIGCGLAGLKDENIAPMFEKAPSNCLMDTAWIPYFTDDRQYWGTF